MIRKGEIRMIEVVSSRDLRVMDTPAKEIRKPTRARLTVKRKARGKMLNRIAKGACLACVFGEVSAIHLECAPVAVILIIVAFLTLGMAIVTEEER